MAQSPTLEQRVTLLERQVQELIESKSTVKKGWVSRIRGSFKGEPDFAEIVRLGQEFRWADRPKPDGE